MLNPIKVVDIELSRPLVKFEGLDGYMGLQGLVRLHGAPIGYIKAPVTAGCVSAKTLSTLILEQHSWSIIHHLLQNGLAAPPRPEKLRLEDLFDVPPPQYSGTLPLVTVAVCTRDRPTDLALCLDALSLLDYPALDILVVDNAPSSDATKCLVQTKYPHVRYVTEPRPGLDWARNRAIIEARGEIIAYTDDDVVVDAGWVKALAKVFIENPEVMAITGLVVPYELETEAQVLFEMQGGFGKGFKRKWYEVKPNTKTPWWFFATGNYGTGANMAYRRSVFAEVGYFDPALDVGTLTNGAGDLEMFFRVVKGGHTLVYEPNAIVRHRHRRDYEKLRKQLHANGAVFAYFMCSIRLHPEEAFSFLRLGLTWLWSWHIRRLFMSFMYPTRFPRDLIWAELMGCFTGLGTYQKSSKVAAQIAQDYGSLPPIKVPKKPVPSTEPPKLPDAIAVRTVELTQPLQPIVNTTDYANVRVYVTWNHSAIGSFDIEDQHQPISVTRLCEAIVDSLGIKLLQADPRVNVDECAREAIALLKQQYTPTEPKEAESIKLPVNVSASIVVGTYDRPDDLRKCLRSLVDQESLRQVEVIVVDNHPTSGLTPPVVAEFPEVILVSEPRQGVAYARNAGIIVSKGDIVVTVDDDVTIFPDWLEKLIAPFARADVMTVSGNILPRELQTESQQIFEQYGSGGLGRGFNRFEVDGDWFEHSWMHSVPTWELGGTANAAFRATIFSHPEIGLMDEALGPGMPSGVGEDIYIFYKVLKAGYTIVYEPAALVWHKHRRDMSALRRQLYNYSKGIISYHLTTFLCDRDLRGLLAVAIGLPMWQMQRIRERFQRRCAHPIPMILLDIAGNLAGPWSLWQSRQRVKGEGRSAPYIPVSQRVDTTTSKLILAETPNYANVGEFYPVSKN
ncbi:MAG: glycosyltransferase [Kastovskya adunca ATA6-11-RM4]|jgi:GT2 family glycosyltransferase|nr:glycosyltransferase [Kastovskya adunca ATA6-11-RM4]